MMRFLTESATDLYDLVDFNTDDLYNQPPPEPWIAFLLGGILSAVGLILWFQRVEKIKKLLGRKDLSGGSIRLRSWLTAYIDNDSALYTCVKMAGQSFIFLGALQLNYRLAFSIILGVFAFESCFDSLRVLLSFREAKDLDDVVVTSRSVRTELRKHPLTILQPSNVYEDLTRGTVIVGMVFMTQCILVSFVVTDIFDSETHSCLDGTSGCPVTGTLGSWGFYVLGIFMACVFLLGPNTNFGQSEQNPAFWLQLLLSAKQSNTKVTWFDPVHNETRSRVLHSMDWRIWIRFLMSFLINGVGFHILVHALPIQVAGQSSLTGVVFRAVGMMYLVDLDDTPGYEMTLVNKTDSEIADNGDKKAGDPAETLFPTKTEEAGGSFDDEDSQNNLKPMDEGELATLAQKIIADAQSQLDGLAAGKGLKGTNTRVPLLATTGEENESATTQDQAEATSLMTAGDLPENSA